MTCARLSALVLVSCLLISLADAAGPVGEENKPVTIHALSVYKVFGKSMGAAEEVTIWYDQSPDKRTRVAFIEDEIDGYGEMWRAAAWQAVLVAADLCGRDLTGTRIFLERSGRVDGPSAGAITTIGVLAALRGDTIKPDVAMTGTINPDGTIGPVGGIPQKIDGAAAAGMRLVLVPYGMRTDFDVELDRPVDLVERGEDKGVEVRLVGDIYTAYKLVTGSELPRAAPAPTPTLSSAMYRRVRIKVDEWMVRYRDQLSEYKEVPEDFRTDFTEKLVAEAAELVKGIDKLLAEGQAPAAYSDLYDAALNAATASEVARTIWVTADRGHKEAVLYAKGFAQLKTRLRVATQKLKNYKPRTLGQAGTLIYAYANLTQAICLQNIGGLILDGKLQLPMFMEIEDKDEEQLERVLEAVTFLQSAAYCCELVDDMIDMAGELNGRPLPKDLPLEATAEFFRRASQANLNQFEKSVVDSKADALGVSFDKMQNAVLVDDVNYLLAWWATHPGRAELFSRFDEETLGYAKLGLAIHTYSLSSCLMAEHYSLGIEYDDEGEISGVKREAPLQFMLDFSEDQARRNVQVLRDAGVDASDIVFSCMAASVYRGRDLPNRLYSLQLLWEANIVARTIAYLGGFADGVETQPDGAEQDP